MEKVQGRDGKRYMYYETPEKDGNGETDRKTDKEGGSFDQFFFVCIRVLLLVCGMGALKWYIYMYTLSYIPMYLYVI